VSPYEGPTEPLRPGAPAPVAAERVVAAPGIDPGLVVARLERTIDSLRTWVLIAGLAAVAALAVAIYAAVTADDAGGGRAAHSGYATNARVDRLSSDVKALRASNTGGVDTAGLTARVAALEAAAKNSGAATGGGGAAALAGRVATLESEVKTLAGRPAPADPTSAIQQLSSRVDALSTQVAQLRQSAPATP
jgi:outer membrane murein-binding lipoprotein Lpp